MAEAWADAVPDPVAVDWADPAGTPIEELMAVAWLRGPEVEVATVEAALPLDIEVECAFVPVEVARAVEFDPATATDTPPVDAVANA